MSASIRSNSSKSMALGLQLEVHGKAIVGSPVLAMATVRLSWLLEQILYASACCLDAMSVAHCCEQRCTTCIQDD